MTGTLAPAPPPTPPASDAPAGREPKGAKPQRAESTAPTSWWRSSAGFVSIGGAVVLAVVAFAALFGVGHNDSTAKFFKGDAWLPSNDSGSVVRVNGATGKPDFEMRFKDAKGADLQVIQGPDGVFVLNRDTGEVTKLDDAQLQLGGSVKADPNDNPAFLIGGGKGFLVSQRTGRVQQVDPSKATLDPVGSAVELKHPISNAVVDPRGRLAAAISETGELAFVADGKADAPVRVADPNDELRVSLVDDQLFAVDHTKATVAPVDPTTGVQTVYTIDVPRDGKLAVTEKMTGPRLWVLHVQSARLIGIDVGTGRQSKIDLDEVKGHELGAPLPNGLFVYVPDFQLGALLKVDPETGKILDRARVVDTNDPNRDAPDGRPFTAFVKDDRVWGNDPRGQVAVVIDREGNAQQIEKYREGLPNSDDLKPLPDALPATTLPKAPVTTAPKQNPRNEPKTEPQTDPRNDPQTPVTTQPDDANGRSTPNDPGTPGAPGAPDQEKRQLPGIPDAGGVTEKSPANPNTPDPGTPGTPGDPTTPTSPIDPTNPNPTPTPPPPAANVPGAPTGVQASAGDGSATVTWEAPATNGSPIAGYVVADAARGVTQQLPATSTTTTITGLTNGTTYTFTVSARNGIGFGPSAAAAPVTPAAALPGPPSNFSTAYLEASDVRTDFWPIVRWSAPTQNPQLVDHYNVSCAPPGPTPGPTTTVPVGTGGPYSLSFADLPLGVGVTCWVSASDRNGQTSARAAMAPGTVVTPWGTPNTATNTGISMNGSDAVLRFAADFNGGRPVSGFRVVVERFDGSMWAPYSTLTPGAGATTVTLPNITNGDYRALLDVTNRDPETGISLTSRSTDYVAWTFSTGSSLIGQPSGFTHTSADPTTADPTTGNVTTGTATAGPEVSPPAPLSTSTAGVVAGVVAGVAAATVAGPSFTRTPAPSVDHFVAELVALFLKVSSS